MLKKHCYSKWMNLVIGGFVLGGFMSGFTLPAHAMSIQGAVAHTLCTGPDVAMSTYNRLAIDYEVKQAFGGYYPTLDLTAAYGREYTNNSTTRGLAPATIGTPPIAVPKLNTGPGLLLWRTEVALVLRQVVFDGFAVRSEVSGKKARMRAQAWRVDSTAERVALEVIESFLTALLEKKLVQNAKHNLDTHARLFGKIRERTKGGVGREVDLYQAEGRLALARTNFLAEQSRLKDAEARYLRLVGLPAIGLTEPELPKHGLPCNLAHAIAMGIKRHPELKAATTDVLVTKAAKELAKAPLYPSLDLEVSGSHGENMGGSSNVYDSTGLLKTAGARSESASVMLKARWNLFRGGSDVANIKQKAYKIEEAKEIRNRSHRETEETVRLAWNLYQTATIQLPFFAKHMNSTMQVREAYVQQYGIGQRTLLDLLDTENEVLSAKNAHARALKDQLLGSFRVLRSTGCLLDYLGVPKPEAARIN